MIEVLWWESTPKNTTQYNMNNKHLFPDRTASCRHHGITKILISDTQQEARSEPRWTQSHNEAVGHSPTMMFEFYWI